MPAATLDLHSLQLLTGAVWVAGDTGGIVNNDWSTISWTKINYMMSIGLNPWYTGGQGAPATPAARSGLRKP